MVHDILFMHMPISHDANQTKFTNSARYKCLEHLRKTGVDLYLSYCGIEECDPSHAYGPTARTEYLLHYILDGEGTFSANGKTWKLGKHQIFLICPGVETYYKADEKKPWKYLWVGFSGAKAKTYLEYANLGADRLIGSYENAEFLLTYVKSMLDASKLTSANELKREGYLFLFLAALMERNGEVKGKGHDYSFRIYVEHALEFIEHNYRKEIRVTDIAEYIGVTRNYLSACFQKTLNLSPQQYLIQYRMEKAKDLLKTTNDSINSIATKVGYEDALAFSRIFRQTYKISPKALRASADTTIETDIIPEH